MAKWNATQTPLPLQAGEVHIWRANLRSHRKTVAALAQTLAPEESAKARQFRRPRDGDRYIFARGVLRTILARYLRIAPDTIRFSYGRFGKPALANDAVRFSVSHSSNLVVCAVSGDTDVGVDIERVRSGPDREVGACLSPTALRPFSTLSDARRRRGFFQSWTRMEAYGKALGEGLEPALSFFHTFVPANCEVIVPLRGEPDPERRCWIQDFSPQKGYVAALAARQKDCRVEYAEWIRGDGST